MNSFFVSDFFLRVTLAVELVLKNCRALGYSPVSMSTSGQYPFPYNFIRKFKDANSTIKKRILDGEMFIYD